MGSCMSGNHGRRSQAVFADSLACLDISEWRRRHWLVPNDGGTGRLEIINTDSGDARVVHVEYELEEHGGSARIHDKLGNCFALCLRTTQQHLAGIRWWFCCPGCDQNRKKLYLDGGLRFSCRACLGLTYRTKHVGAPVRARMRSDYFYRKASAFRGAQTHYRPKRMHRRTFEMLLLKAEHFGQVWQKGRVEPMHQEFGVFRERLRKRLQRQIARAIST